MKNINKVIFLLLIALTVNFISCQKKSKDIKTNIGKTQEIKTQIEKSQEQRYLQKRQYLLEREINNFFNKVEQARDNVAGELVVSFKEKGEKISKTTNQKLHKEELNDFFNKVEQTGDNIAGELVIRSKKLTNSIILDTVRLPSLY